MTLASEYVRLGKITLCNLIIFQVQVARSLGLSHECTNIRPCIGMYFLQDGAYK
jgi:hypothetical protein